jgi:exosortase/archaeosortase family protein
LTRLFRFAPCLVALGATHDVWRWFAVRIVEGVDAAQGLIPFAAAFAAIGVAPPSSKPALRRPTIVWLAIYGAASIALPPSLAAYAAFGALLSSFAAARGVVAPVSTYALLATALPVLPHLDFFAGYPMRVVAAAGAAEYLRFSGEDFERLGATLVRDGRVFSVDSPCSGVKMLWSASVLAAALAAFLRTPFFRTVLCGAAAILGTLVGNAFRTALLVLMEARGGEIDDATHAGIGLVVFAPIAYGLYKLAARRRPRAAPSTLVAPARGARSADVVVFLLVAVAAAFAPSSRVERADLNAAADLSPPTSFEGRSLSPVAPSASLRAVDFGFPGRLAVLSDGERVVIWRRVLEPTRRLHALSYCLRCGGSELSSLPPKADGSGALWSRFSVLDRGESYELRERIVSDDGAVFGDVSSWWWSAATGTSKGPWTAWAVVSKVEAAAVAEAPR